MGDKYHGSGLVAFKAVRLPDQISLYVLASVSSKVKALSAELQSQGKASNAKAAAQVAGGLDKNKSKACTVM